VVILERTIIGSSALVMLIAMAHPALGFQKVYGVYTPRNDVSIIGPFLNSNHLSAYVNIGLIVALASSLSSRPVAPRFALAVLVILFTATEVWLASRGGVSTMALGMLLIAGLSLGSRRSGSWVRKGALSGTCAIVGVGLLVLAGSEKYSGLADRDTSKLGVIARCFTSMLPAYPIFGAGRGAFESTFQEFREGTGFVLFTHPENIVAQWTVEWGAPVAAAGLIVVAIALRPKTLFARAHRPIGAWCAILVALLHNLVDFSLEIPGVVVTIAACAACIVGGTSGVSSRTRGMRAWATRPKRVALVGAVAATGGILLALDTQGHDVFEDRARLLASAQSGQDLEHFHDLARAALLAHPAEPYFSYVAAGRAQATESESPLPWVAHTLERAPLYPPAHVLLARWLRRRSPSHARVEYRINAAQSAEGMVPFDEIASLVGSFDDAMELIPDGVKGTRMLATIADHVGDRLPATQVRLDAELLRRAPMTKEPAIRLATRALQDLLAEEAAPWCTRDRRACIRLGLDAAAEAERLAPNRCEAFAVRARILMLNGDGRLAVDHLAAAADTASDRALCLRELAAIAISASDEETATAVIEKLSRLPCDTGSPCVESLLQAADLEELRGHRNRALVFLRRAAGIAQGRDDVLERLGGLASRSGLRNEALSAFEKLAAKHPNDRRLRQMVDDERTRATAN
jgi:tetratricopeptide (TPR) repeat protein